jgi:trehalose 6-phosphate synthase/phosphatase
MLVVPSRDQVEMYKKLKEEVDELVGRINAKYSTIAWTPIQYFYRSLPFDELAALYSLADVALVTPLRDGMNLVAKEFIASKADQRGVLILSERAGAAQDLSDALLINPTNTGQLVEALNEALLMPEDEQKNRMTHMQHLVRQYDVFAWTELFMNRLSYSKIKQLTYATDPLDGKAKARLLHDYQAAPRRLLFLDFNGTLAPFHATPDRAKPDDELLQLLSGLTQNPQNEVVIVSGHDRNALENWFGHLRVGFIAELGVWLRRAGEDWTLFQDMRTDWKRELRPVLDQYVNRTAGSFIEDKEYSLAWHYRRADAGLGAARARELLNHLTFITASTDLQVIEGEKVLEVKNAGINKGAAAARWLTGSVPEFILAIGDDRTDEDTFRAMPPEAYTVKVGSSNRSLAHNCVGDFKQVRQLLAELAKVKVEENNTDLQAA